MRQKASGPVLTIIGLFRRVTATMLDDFLARMASAGFDDLSPSHQAVFENMDAGGTRLSALAARARMTQQSMSELVSALEQRGYVVRTVDESDRRARLVQLTPKGREMARRAIREMKAIEDDWEERFAVAPLSGGIVEALARALADSRIPGTVDEDPTRLAPDLRRSWHTR